MDNPRTIVAVNEADGAIEPLTTFITRSYVMTAAAAPGGMFEITSLIAVPFRDDLLALAHTEEYLVKIFDPAADKIVREFRRAYERVKGEPLTEAEKKGSVIMNGKRYTRPERKFENDVKNILTRNDEIWAVTSTKDKAKGVLIDVFDGEGVYRDCFWLKLPSRPWEAFCRRANAPSTAIFSGSWNGPRTRRSIKKYRVVI